MSNKHLVILTDIFGVTAPLKSLGSAITKTGKVTLIDPYQQQAMQFASEAIAYQYFVEHVGLDNYLAYAKQQLSRLTEVDTVIGFSVGGSVLWRLLAEDAHLLSASQNICFYPSQVRYYLELVPQRPCTIYLPSVEKHFSVAAMARSLINKPGVTIITTPYLHGYMNKLSENFDPQGYQASLKELALG